MWPLIRIAGAPDPRLRAVRVFVPAEVRAGEKRVAILPGIVPKLAQLGFDVHVQAAAGAHAFASDADANAWAQRLFHRTESLQPWRLPMWWRLCVHVTTRTPRVCEPVA